MGAALSLRAVRGASGLQLGAHRHFGGGADVLSGVRVAVAKSLKSLLAVCEHKLRVATVLLCPPLHPRADRFAERLQALGPDTLQNDRFSPFSPFSSFSSFSHPIVVRGPCGPVVVTCSVNVRRPYGCGTTWSSFSASNTRPWELTLYTPDHYTGPSSTYWRHYLYFEVRLFPRAGKGAKGTGGRAAAQGFLTCVALDEAVSGSGYCGREGLFSIFYCI